MFSGIGGFEKAIGNYGECVGYSEIDKYAIQIYEKHFPNHKNYGDATKINAKELPDFDLLVGGFPCQAFSIAGKRRGLEDSRGTLFYDIARIVQEKRPQHLLLENVKGLLSHDNGRTFKLIISTFTEVGYNLEWQVLNSKNFGVPQNRERVFIIGHLGRCCGRQVFPLGSNNEETAVGGVYTGTLTSRYPASQREGTYIEETRKRKGEIEQINNPTHSNDRVYGTGGLSPTLNTMQGGNRQPFIAPVLTPDRLHKRQNGRRFKDNGEPGFTLTSQDKHGIYDGVKIRRLTPIECERLQGFPDNWTRGLSDTQRYKCLGNAVTVNVIEHIIKQLTKNI